MRCDGVRQILLAALIISACAGASRAQTPPRGATPPPAEAGAWPYPPPDPQSWWDDKWPQPPEAADPLGGRRLPQGQHLTPIDNGIDPSTYRLWGLTPLQWQVLRGGEMVLEVWVRPSNSVRQSVSRVIVRHDGRAFVQGRAGLACCEADISRRMGFDAELPAGSAQTFLALRNHPMWSAPRLVQVREARAAEGVCVDGVSYDLTLLVPGRATTLHRACDPAAIGQVADVLEPVLRAALGHDPRFDVLFRGGADFRLDRDAYRELLAGGGALKPDTDGPVREDVATPPAAAAPAPEQP